MPCFQLCPQIIRNAEIGTETGRAEEKSALSGKAHWSEKRKRASSGQNWAKPTPAQQSRPRREAVE
jgi:hypothetical protein